VWDAGERNRQFSSSVMACLRNLSKNKPERLCELHSAPAQVTCGIN
jgi:hypothetical protein